MTGLLSTIGIDVANSVDVFVGISIYTIAVVTILWVVGLFQGSHSIMDAYYGFGYAIPAVLAYVIVRPSSATAAVLLAMALFHGCRLGWYLGSRWRRYVPIHGGDPRYMGFVSQYSPGYWWKSFFRVMEPQAVVIILIGSPAVWGILQTRQPGGPIGLLAFLGIAVFGVGLYFESLADGQLQAFLADANNKGRYLHTGVWTHSRHPNYFGTTTVWWGVWLVAVSGAPSAWWTVIGPIVNTVMLAGVLGANFQDKYMGSRPEYQKLMLSTRRFLPIPLSKEKRSRADSVVMSDGTTPRQQGARD